MEFVLLWCVLIDRMGSEDFRTRQEAHGALEAATLCHDGLLPIVAFASAAHRDPEVRHRCGQIVDAYYSKVLDGELPWIDMLPADHPSRQQTIDRYLRPTTDLAGFDGGDWPRYRLATALLVRDLFDQGWRRSEVIVLIKRMDANERKYKQSRPQSRQ